MERQSVEYTVRGIKYKVNLLNEIQDETDAYVIGYLAADGSFSYGGKKNFMKMGISSKNRYILEGIRTKYIPLNSIRKRVRNISITNAQGKKYKYQNNVNYELDFPIRFSESLVKYGIAKPKTQRVIAGVPKKYWSACILGFLDADGSIQVRHRKDRRTSRLNIHIVTSARTITRHIQRECENVLKIGSSIYERKNADCVDFKIETTKSAIKFCKWIYNSLPDFYNYQKKKIFDSYMSCVSSGELLESP